MRSGTNKVSEPEKELTLHFASDRQYGALYTALMCEAYVREREHGVFLFASFIGGTELDVVDVAVLKSDDFIEQTANYLELHDSVLQDMIVRAHENNTALVEVHSHPFTRGKRIRFSHFDCEGLADIGPHVAWRLPGRPYIALVFGRDSFDSLYWEGQERMPRGSVNLMVAGRLLRASRVSERNWRRDYGQVR